MIQIRLIGILSCEARLQHSFSYVSYMQLISNFLNIHQFYISEKLEFYKIAIMLVYIYMSENQPSSRTSNFAKLANKIILEYKAQIFYFTVKPCKYKCKYVVGIQVCTYQ